MKENERDHEIIHDVIERNIVYIPEASIEATIQSFTTLHYIFLG